MPNSRSIHELRVPRRLIATLVVVLLGTGVFGTSGAIAMQFCKQDAVVQDYLAPLAHLPKVRTFSKSGRLSVGPATLRIYPPRENLVAVHHGEFEVRGGLDNLEKTSGVLNWQITSKLERINRKGEPLDVVKKAQQRVSRTGDFERSFGFPGLAAPGLYLVTVEIANRKGKRLTRYQEYFRAVKARSDLRLVTDFTTLAPGETGHLRVENFGTVFGGYGPGYSLWNKNGEEVPIEAIFSNPLLFLKAGYAGGCSLFKAPEGLPPGEYRIEAEAQDRLRDRALLETFVTIS